MSVTSERMWEAVSRARWRLTKGWQVWETTRGTMWARAKKGWQGAPQIEQEPMTDDEEAVVDYLLREEDNGS